MRGREVIISWLNMGTKIGPSAPFDLLSRWAAYDEPEGESKDLRIRLNVYSDRFEAWWFPNGAGPDQQQFVKRKFEEAPDADLAKSWVLNWIRSEFGVGIEERRDYPNELRPLQVHPKTREVMEEIGMLEWVEDPDVEGVSADPNFGGVVVPQAISEYSEKISELTSGPWEWHVVTGSKMLRHAMRRTPNGRASMHVEINRRGDDLGYQGRIELDAWDRRWVHTVNAQLVEDIDRLAESWADTIVNNRPEETDPMSTTDAAYWAATFIKRFGGKYITAYATDPEDGEVDFGTMVAWFANAIETGRKAGRESVEVDKAELDVHLSFVGETLSSGQRFYSMRPGDPWADVTIAVEAMYRRLTAKPNIQAPRAATDEDLAPERFEQLLEQMVEMMRIRFNLLQRRDRELNDREKDFKDYEQRREALISQNDEDARQREAREHLAIEEGWQKLEEAKRAWGNVIDINTEPITITITPSEFFGVLDQLRKDQADA